MKKNWLTILFFIFLVGAVVWAGKGIFKYNVFSTHDGDHHIARVFDVIQTAKEGQFPLRWAGSLNYFCGVPIYNFFYPLIYYLAVVINLVTNNVILTLKIIDFLSLLVGTLFFYFWIKTETKKELPAIGGALTYLYAPYRFSLIFVRGSPEFLAYAVLPIVLFFYALCFRSVGKKFVLYAFLASVMGAVLTTSHNFTVMFLMPIILVYLVIQIWLRKSNLKNIFWIAFSFFGSFGMGSFFIGPALMEQKFTKIGQGFLEWRDHFPTLGQLFKSKWGYFYSSSGTVNDGMSFMLGYAQWLILGIALIFLVYQIIKTRFKLWTFFVGNVWIIFYFLASLFTIYLILPWSIPLWEKIKPLQEIQFSWRLLGIAIFTTSALFSFLLAKINSKFVYVCIFIAVSLLTVVGTRNFMLPQPISVEDLYRYDDFEKLHPHRYSTTTLGDDVLAPSAGSACWFDTPIITTDKEKIIYEVVEKGNTFGFVKFDIPKSLKGETLVMGLGYFPGNYKFEINGKALSYKDCGGKVCFDTKSVRSGQNYISWKVVQSPIENTFNYIALAFFGLWVVALLIYLTGIYKNKKNLAYLISAIIIFTAFIFFRSYNLPGRIGFGWDQERDAWAVANILAGKMTLLGPRVQGPAGFFLPPYFFYLLAPFYALNHSNTFATVSFIVFWAITFFVGSYLIISRVFGRRTALFFLALWAINPLAVSIDTISWNPVLVPGFFILLIYLVYLYFIKPSVRNIFFAGIVFGLGLSFHLQFLFIVPFFIPLAIEVVKNKRFKDLVGFGIGSTLPFLPILFFDLRHNFLNFKQVLEFAKGGDIGINRVLVVWERASSFMVGGSPSLALGLGIYFIVLVGLFVFVRKSKNDIQGKVFLSLGLVWALSLPLFNLLIKNPSEYYFNYMLVPFIIFLSYLFKSWKRFGVLVLVGLVIYFAIQAKPLLRDVSLSLREKDMAVSQLGMITKNATPFDISFDVPFNEDTGFRYLLKFYKVNPSGKATDPLIEFIIPAQKKPNAFAIGRIGLTIPSSWLSDNWPKPSK